MPANAYSIIKEKGVEDSVAFIMTRNDSVIEAHIYSGIVISFKSLRLSFEQICDALSQGDIKEITFQKAEVRPELAQARVISHTFPEAVAAAELDPARTTPSKLIRIVRLMSGLIKAQKDEESKAFDMIRRHLSTLYPGFLPDVPTIQGRIGRLGEEFGMSVTFLQSNAMPADIHSVPRWLLGNFDAIGDGPVKEVIVYYIFFGEVAGKIIRTTVEQETSLGARQGYAILSKTAYPEVHDKDSVNIFQGVEKIGKIKIDWHTDEKKTIAMTKADLDHMGLRKGDKINLIFED